MAAPTSDLDPATRRQLSEQLALRVLERAAPDETLVFEEVAEEYFEDPASALAPSRRDEPVGFGLEVALLAPFALAVADFLVGFMVDLLKDAAMDAAKPSLTHVLRRVLHLPGEDKGQSDPPDLTSEQRERIFAAVTAEAARLGLDDDRSTLLGHATLGALTTGGS
ncbi:hypothetical protein ACH9D2_07325 [Kocuria sp. M4R2S49]|uniref:hypothetical protein n=1 Tax=Kocuria rhizosphaericola TaxID=3376284 RepID=UPI00378A419C